MKKRILLVGVLVIIGTGIIWHHQQKNVNASMATAPTYVETSRVELATIPKIIHAIGTLAARSVEITPEVAGHVEKIYFTDGAAVKQGDVLIKLDDTIYKAKYQSAQAKLNLSEMNYKRTMQLGKKGIISKQATDQAESDLKERKAETAEAAAMLGKMTLRAPFAGVVGKSNISEGDYVNGGDKLVKLTDIDHLRIEYNLPEKYIAAIKPNQTVSIKTTSYPDRLFEGKVSFISPTINSESRTLFVYADIPNDSHVLVAGMFVDVSQSLGADENVLVIPERSLVPVLDGEQVYKVVDGKAYSVDTVTGQRKNGKVEIISGLKADDIIVTDGQLKLKNGMQVQTKG